MKMCAMDKAPGPDGFTMGFYIKCWEVLKKDIMGTFRNSHARRVFGKSFSVTYVTLIPKHTRAKELRDFRPISLIGSIYNCYQRYSQKD